MMDKNERENENIYGAYAPSQLHCKNCKTLMENGVCPTCGYKVYVPMSKEKREKVKTVVTAVAVAVLIAVFVIIQFLKD